MDNVILEYFSISSSNSYISVIDIATRVTEKTAPLIDHVWLNNKYVTYDAGIVLSSTSDHFPCLFSIPLNNVDNYSTFPPILLYSSFTSTLFFPPYVHESYGTGNYNIISGSLKNSNFHRIFDTSKNMFKNIFSNLY